MLGKRLSIQELAQQDWDIIVIGGGITGAGVLLEAARRGQKALLLEQRDFAWGTSSRSSKMVHGGLRYIAQGHIKLTKDALLERERMLKEIPNLVVRMPYTFLIRKGEFPGRWPMHIVLWLYDTLAGIRDQSWLSLQKLAKQIPGINPKGLKGAIQYTDALTDDSRLVLRILHEAVAQGAQLNNYTQVAQTTQTNNGLNIDIKDALTNETSSITAKHVINATGSWADILSGTSAKIRPLRGSHIFIAKDKFPINTCITALHPKDNRPVFIYPWQGVTTIGTTDLDHKEEVNLEPRCSKQELDYLWDLLGSQFPDHGLTHADILSTMAGVRPVISSGKGLDPSKESREHTVWEKNGVVTVSGGKLTTFRLIALDALKTAGVIDEKDHKQSQRTREKLFASHTGTPKPLYAPFDALPTDQELLDCIEWVLENEMVTRLDDLLLRRVRLGNVLAHGAKEILPDIKPLCQQHLGWNDAYWEQEQQRYLEIIEKYYSVPTT